MYESALRFIKPFSIIIQQMNKIINAISKITDKLIGVFIAYLIIILH